MSGGLGIGVGAPGLGAPPPSPEAHAWLRTVTRWPLYEGRTRHVEVYTTRWDDYTAKDIRDNRVKRFRDAHADVTIERDRIVYRMSDGSGRVETLTFHDVDPGEVVIG